MKTKNSEMYLSKKQWLGDVMNGENVVICNTSALEYLELFLGYISEEKIDVYALSKGIYENVNYKIVNSFDEIDTVRIGNVLCTSINQTINDMLQDFNTADEQSLVEALSYYYFTHDKSFEGIEVHPEKEKKFQEIKEWAIEYYMGG